MVTKLSSYVALILALSFSTVVNAQDVPPWSEILANPDKLVANQDIVLQVYKKFAASESRFAELHEKFKALAGTMVNKHNVVKDDWAKIAEDNGLDSQKDKLTRLSTLLSSSVKQLAKTAHNKHVDSVKASVDTVAAVYDELQSKLASGLDDATKRRLNAEIAESAAANLALVEFWNNTFKDVADQSIIRRQIREAVYRAKGVKTKPLLKSYNELRLKVDAHRKIRTELLQKFIKDPSSADEESVEKLMSAVKSIASGDVELDVAKKKLDAAKKAESSLLKDFGL